MPIAENTRIAWCDHTFNPWTGCTKVAPECAHCYAAEMANRFPTFGRWGNDGSRVLTSDANWNKVRAWNRKAAGLSRRPRVFCASLADVFEDWDGPILDHEKRPLVTHGACGITAATVSLPSGNLCCGKCGAWANAATMQDVRSRLFGLIDGCQNLDFLLLTKRPENIRRFWPAKSVTAVVDRVAQRKRTMDLGGCRRSNVWLGTSAGTQETADTAIPELLTCRDLSPVLFVSAEPLLEPVDFSEWLFEPCRCANDAQIDPSTGAVEFCSQCDGSGISSDPAFNLDWIITGGESGPNARRCCMNWIDSIKWQCGDTGVACFVKQLGANAWAREGSISGRIKLSHPKGEDLTEWPDHLRVQEFPEVTR